MAGATSWGNDRREQDLLTVAVEVQRMIEGGAYKPLPLTTVGSQLSMNSHMVLLHYHTGLLGVVEMHPRLFKVSQHDGCQMVSCCGVPWLGPAQPGMRPEALVCKMPTPAHAAPTEQAGGAQCPTSGMPRGKALEMMSELAETPALQDTLREIAEVLSEVPGQTMLVSEVGSRLGASARSFLRSVKLRVGQLLQCFPDDFTLHGTGPGTAVAYRHQDLKRAYMPQPSVAEVNSGRLYRLLKLAADVTEHFPQAKPISARDVLSNYSSCLLVDCRSAEERSISALANSITAAEAQDSVMAAPLHVVAYCCIGSSSAKWCQDNAAGTWGYKLRYLTGGVAGWAHHGGTFVHGMTGQRVGQVHCWLPELGPFFPVAESGYQAVVSQSRPVSALGLPPSEVLGIASTMRRVRLRNLAWEVRLRYFPTVFCVEAEDLEKMARTGHAVKLLIVDCRTGEERAVSTMAVPGCLCVSKEDFQERALEWLQAYDHVITFCTIGGRSGTFCSKIVASLLDAGHFRSDPDVLRRKVVNLLGGIAAWMHAQGGLVDTQGAPTKQLHPWCRSFLDMFPLEGLEIVFDEARPMPHDALSLVACKTACTEVNADATVPQRLLQLCNTLPREVIRDSLTRAAESCCCYED